jgi:hypothetical protein
VVALLEGVLHQEISHGGGLLEGALHQEISHGGGGGLLEGVLHQETSHGGGGAYLWVYNRLFPSKNGCGYNKSKNYT